jgi:hypothetical protein
MKIFLQVKDNRIVGWGSTRGLDTDIETEVVENHEVLKNPFIFTYQNGQLAKDETYQQQLIKEKEDQMNKPSLEEEITSLKKQNADLAFQLMLNGVL